MRFATGLLLGSMIGVLGTGYAMQDNRTKRKMVRESKELATKAGQMMDDMTDKIHW